MLPARPELSVVGGTDKPVASSGQSVSQVGSGVWRSRGLPARPVGWGKGAACSRGRKSIREAWSIGGITGRKTGRNACSALNTRTVGTGVESAEIRIQSRLRAGTPSWALCLCPYLDLLSLRSTTFMLYVLKSNSARRAPSLSGEWTPLMRS